MTTYLRLKEALFESIEFSPEDIAELFCELGCSQMADFFDEVSRISETWRGTFAMQMQYVKDSPELTAGAKYIMKTIGDYAE